MDRRVSAMAREDGWNAKNKFAFWLSRRRNPCEIGWIAIMFTDLKGSTELYDALGDATAYNLTAHHPRLSQRA
jgi:class 3 adenylate cyclase